MDTSQIFAMVFSLLTLAAALVGFGYSVYQSIAFVKDKRTGVDIMPYIKKSLYGNAFFIVLITVSFSLIFAWNGYSATAVEWIFCIFGTFFLAGSLCFGFNGFIYHYYGKNVPEKIDRRLYLVLMASIPLTFIFFFLCTNAFANIAGPNYLFPSGLNFTKGFVSPQDADKPNIAFYALCILSGAIFVYFLSDHFMYKEYGKHGTLETTFLICFPVGIIGARIAYVIGNWTKDGFGTRMANGEWWCIFAIWEGGLTILGGAIAGIIAGILAYKLTNKGRSVFTVIDYVVPAILIAQAVGRWGNFFNCEVHGGLSSIDNWGWLPRIVLNNARYSSASGLGWAPEGYIYVPLFFIESITNIFGYCVLAHLFGIKFKKLLAPGDLGAGYLIWYGLTRVFMEPLRHPAFKMGEKDFWSWIWALVFVVVGALLIAINHIVRYQKNREKGLTLPFALSTRLSAVICLGLIALPLMVFGIVLMSTNSYVAVLEYNAFNGGIVFLVLGFSFLIILVACLYEYINLRKKER